MEGSKLYVGNIGYSTTSEQLKELFSAQGTVSEVNVISGKGFGFVQMSTQEEAQKAQEALNGTEFGGRTIKVEIARPMKPKSGGFGGGGFKKGNGFKRGGFNRNRPPRY